MRPCARRFRRLELELHCKIPRWVAVRDSDRAVRAEKKSIFTIMRTIYTVLMFFLSLVPYLPHRVIPENIVELEIVLLKYTPDATIF